MTESRFTLANNNFAPEEQLAWKRHLERIKELPRTLSEKQLSNYRESWMRYWDEVRSVAEKAMEGVLVDAN